MPQSLSEPKSLLRGHRSFYRWETEAKGKTVLPESQRKPTDSPLRRLLPQRCSPDPEALLSGLWEGWNSRQLGMGENRPGCKSQSPASRAGVLPTHPEPSCPTQLWSAFHWPFCSCESLCTLKKHRAWLLRLIRLEHSPINRKVVGLILSQDSRGCRLGTWSGHI